LKSPVHLGLLGVLFERRSPSLQFGRGGIEMTKKLLSCLVAGALAATLALASPVFARGGGGGGMHGGGMGGGWHGGGMGGGWHGGGMHVGGMGGGWHGDGMHLAGTHFSHAGFSPGFSHHRIFFHHHNRFAFVGLSYGYDGCWRRAWTPYGLQWVNVCGDDGYY
jgi:hypothetical protein